jgi:UDP-N-acetylmuramate dehydrogenase
MITLANSNRLRGTLLAEEPMCKHTSWRVGGPAECFYVPADLADLQVFLRTQAPSEPIYWLGLGSNLLVRDGGLRGTVIATSGALGALHMTDAQRVRSEAGVPCAKVARFTVRRGLTVAQFLAGIPGTLGGALAMNAGAFGWETWAIVEAVETIDHRGRVRTRTPGDFSVGYRCVRGPAGEWYVAARLRLEQGDEAEGDAHIRALLAKRGHTQPTQTANAGSVFKNPPGDYAARLIEAAGLKGLREGGAVVSELHANFIVNTGTASAADIETLIDKVRERVARAHGVTLELEVRVVGER